jgi:hypothetical protein
MRVFATRSLRRQPTGLPLLKARRRRRRHRRCWGRRRHQSRRADWLRNRPTACLAPKIRFEELDTVGRDDRLGGRRGEFRETRDARGASPVTPIRLVARPRHLGCCRVNRRREEAGPAALVEGGRCEQRWEPRVFLIARAARLQGLLTVALMDITYEGEPVRGDRRSWRGDSFNHSHAQ